jgi:uncharacterized membrane protein
MKKIISFLFQGILYTVPFAITIWVLWKILQGVTNLVAATGFSIHPFIDPLIGLLALFIFLVIIGASGSSLLFNRLFGKVDGFIERTPLIKIIYSSVKDLLSAFVGQKKRFNKPVLVKISNEPRIERLGFVTREGLEEMGLPHGRIAVYFPLSYALTGELLIVDAGNISPLDINSTEMMKFIISGGVTDIDG